MPAGHIHATSGVKDASIATGSELSSCSVTTAPVSCSGANQVSHTENESYT